MQRHQAILSSLATLSTSPMDTKLIFAVALEQSPSCVPPIPQAKSRRENYLINTQQRRQRIRNFMHLRSNLSVLCLALKRCPRQSSNKFVECVWRHTMDYHYWTKISGNSDDIFTLRSHRYLKRIWNTQTLPCLVDLACSFKRDTLVPEYNGIMNLVSNCIIIFHITFLVAREQSAHISRPCWSSNCLNSIRTLNTMLVQLRGLLTPSQWISDYHSAIISYEAVCKHLTLYCGST